MLELKEVSKVYGTGKRALNDVSFRVEKGEFISIIGPSGAGKSTLLRSINQLIPINDGSIIFQDIEVNRAKRGDLRKVRRKIGMIFQHYNLVSRLSVIENVLHGRLGYKSTIRGVIGSYTEEEKQMALDLLTKLGLEEFIYKRCDQLSGGQKQRVGIARALMQQPEVMLCDEPIASLDPKSSKVIMDYLHKITKEMGITCIVNLHQVDVAMEYSDRIIGVSSGEILFDGTPQNLTQEMLNEIYQSEELLM